MNTNISKNNISSIVTKEPKVTKKKLQDYGWAYLMIAPTIIGLIILNIWPIFYTLNLSFHQNGDFGSSGQFVGLANYKHF